ncbi:hypothetical protein [Chryseobacterium sp.]|uniref:hypothetical protein n=1 Tax=Chryseobacterium sp. TaxID=1871047 RepID=UPI0035B28E0A
MNELLFNAKLTPEVITLKPMKYIVVDKKVTAESTEAFIAIQGLYKLSEIIQSKLKDKGVIYELPPLEGEWSLSDPKIGFKDHNNIIGNFMLLQPENLEDDLFNEVKSKLLEESKNKDYYEYLKETNLKLIDENKSIKMLHIGPYTEEQTTFDIMEQFTHQLGLKKLYNYHKESYIKDIRTVSKEQFQTVLKFQVH